MVEAYLSRPAEANERDFKLCLARTGGLLVDEWAVILGTGEMGETGPADVHPSARVAAGARRRRVCVVGAGAAGLSAARELERRGHHVTVLERGDAVAGKCASVEIDGRWYDLGAHFCGGAYREVRALAQEVGCETEPVSPVRVYDLASGALVLPRTALFDRQGMLAYREARRTGFPAIDQPGLDRAGRALQQPVGDWIARREHQIAATFGPAYTASGYGYLQDSEVPALYLAKFVEATSALSEDQSPERQGRWTIAGGFMDLWRRVARGLRDVRCGSRITSIERGAEGVRVVTGEGTLTFDDLVLAMPLERTLSFLDATDEERGLFGQIRSYDYYATVATAQGLPREGFYVVQPHAGDPATVGHCVAFHHRYHDAGVYLFYSYGGAHTSPGDVERLLREDVARLGGRLEAIHLQRRWEHFPHVSTSAAGAGFFQRMAALQGTRHTYYAGAVLGFDLVECTVAHARDVIRGHFLDAAPPSGEPAAVLPVADPQPAPAPAPGGVTRSAGEIRDWMVAAVAQRLGLPAADVDPDAGLELLGLDSLVIVGIMADLSQWLGWQVTPAVIVEYPTISEIARQIAVELAESDERGAPDAPDAPDAPVGPLPWGEPEPVTVTEARPSFLDRLLRSVSPRD
jgi:predicted NAD/FAD-binding protein/acyl carrier protein